MNSFIEILNGRGEMFSGFAWPMLWQSSLLIVGLLAFDFLVRRKVRASVRYTLWLVVLLKLCLPPTLALPTSPAWWLHGTPAPVAARPEIHYTVTYDNTPLPEMPATSVPAFVPPKPVMTYAAWLWLASVVVSSMLLLWLLVRWWQITRLVRRATASERLTTLAEESQRVAGMSFKVRVKLTANSMSPAVCGLFRPAILIPESLAENFSDEQMRAVLLHELIHLRRRDVWMNFVQALLQIAYWWHPLVWVANARIRRVREEAVDDAVMLALRDEAEAYAPTLLEVAKLALNRPLASLGLVGIMESRNALRERIERLLDFHPPRRAGLTVVSLLGVLAFTAVAVPMGEKPPAPEKADAVVTPATPAEMGFEPVPAATNDLLMTLKVNPEIFIRNVKAQATKLLLAPTNDYTFILMEALRGEGVDCNPPHGLRFNGKTGEITTQNTPEKVEFFRQVIEQLNRADGKCELPLRSPVLRRKIVLAESRIYQIRSADFGKFTAGLHPYSGGYGSDTWWSVEPDKWDQLTGSLDAAGLQPVMRPRLQTASGTRAEFFMGDGNNSTGLDCIPIVKEGYVDLTLLGQVISGGLTEAAFTNQFTVKASAENRGGIVVRMENLNGNAGSNLVAVIQLEIVTNSAPKFQQRMARIIQRAPEDAATPSYTPGHQKMVARLGAIRLTRFGPFDGETLDRVMQRLGEAVSQQDTNPESIRFMVAGPDTNRLGLIDPATGQPVKPSDPAVDARATPVHLKTPLEHVTVMEVLGKVVMAAGPAVKYSIADDGVRFSLKNPGASVGAGLFTRTYVVDTRIFISTLKTMGVDITETTNSSREISAAARKFFDKLGVNWEEPPGKAVFFNDKNGMLFVKASESDLAMIDKALQAINQVPPQIHIKARFLQVPRGTVAGLGNLVDSTNSTAAEFTGILDEAKTRAMLHSFAAGKGYETIGEPEVTTLSGRQCQIRATQTITVISNYLFQENTTTNVNGVSAITPQTIQFEAGPMLDVVPYVLADGYTINLTVIPTLNEFLGYDTGPDVPNVTGTNNRVQLPVFFPHFSKRQMTATLNLRDGQTVVIGGMPEIKAYTHKVPVLGSVPLMGRLFRSENTTTNEILVFVTANIVDPAGNRVHTDEESSHFQINAAPDDTQPWHGQLF
ncbi:MAG: M56 family metallopeptidase [Verrucomicrobiae bacterium]|nr:M56 family metallopeptidase [Verrucomicrobiae bacterium]